MLLAFYSLVHFVFVLIKILVTHTVLEIFSTWRAVRTDILHDVLWQLTFENLNTVLSLYSC